MPAPQRFSYQEILADIEALFKSGRHAVIEMYWKIGQRVVEAEQEGNPKAPYGEGLLDRLSRDLTKRIGSGFSCRNLDRMRKFYLENPILPASAKLDWSHQSELLSVKDPKKRQALMRLAQKKNLSFREIRKLAHAQRISERVSENLKSDPKKDKPVFQLKFSRGKLNTCSLVSTSLALNPKGMATLDLGFDLWRLVTKAEAKNITISEKPHYTYSAFVEKVIDGDTLWAQIDCGFGNLTRQKLRLRGIDCPEADTDEGKAAQIFTRKILPVGSLIVIQTHKDDKYGRYLADVFYLKDAIDPEAVAQEGAFLNQELLNERLAVVM